MKGIKEYSIDIFGLKLGEHLFEYSIGDSFFLDFEFSPVTKGGLAVQIKLNKTERMITMTVNIQGEVELICDRSNDPFQYPLKVDQEVIFKFGEEDKELGDDVFQIQWDTEKLNVAQYLYEFVALAIPMKKLHPRYLEDETFEDEIIFTAEAEDDSSEEESVDPRWEALRQLKKDSEEK
ncbi:MAG TPA: hypothetical protein DCE41_23485 [Cytophagales bacterium]|nr:hypothetical protein [Cytophagales bacterium]HAA23671.1 hypothetical protein [Cytophagales bacterium]HAP59253.1 hypothetical protein [Cytophagales bacterium]